MRFTQQEKYEITRLVEYSEIGVSRTLLKLGVRKSTFYNWYGKYKQEGYDGLDTKGRKTDTTWNKIPDRIRAQVVHLALELPELSPRELAHRMIDKNRYYISESSVYRILKSQGLITSPAYIVMQASDEFKDKTVRVNQMWQTDFTYFKIIGWGWYYLSTVMDDYSRYIIHWEICSTITKSNHLYKKYKNLVKDYVSNRPEQLWVSDITYIKTENDHNYLALVTDAYSKQITGYKLDNHIERHSAQMRSLWLLKIENILIKKLIHHSGRVFQYCNPKYTTFAEENRITMSITEQYDPYENAVDERINRTLK